MFLLSIVNAPYHLLFLLSIVNAPYDLLFLLSLVNAPYHLFFLLSIVNAPYHLLFPLSLVNAPYYLLFLLSIVNAPYHLLFPLSLVNAPYYLLFLLSIVNAPYHSSIVVAKPAEGSQASNEGSYMKQERKISLNPRYLDGKQQSAGSSLASHPGRPEQEIKSNTTPRTHSARSNSNKSGDEDRSAASKSYSNKSGDEKPIAPNYVRSNSITSNGKRGSVGQSPGQPSVHDTPGHRLSGGVPVDTSDKDGPAAPTEAGKTVT